MPEGEATEAQLDSPVSLEDATTYQEWSAAAQAADEKSGAAGWRQTDESRRYDYRIIRRRLEEIQEVKASEDPHRILFYLNEGIHGNMGGIGSSSMYKRARFGTKDLITEYIGELASALEMVARVPDEVITFSEKNEFFHRASHCFGRTALMLSGGGALGPFHVGVIKALLSEGLLPNVISGASAGSMIAAIIGTTPENELLAMLDARTVVDGFEEISDGSIELLKGNRRLRIDEVRGFVETMIPDLTFQEAFDLTGQRINISISPRELHQQSRLMNAITSPNVYIREAVLASCAIPGIFPPVTLAAKNAQGQRQPYVPSRQWVDGSVANDLPAKRLSRLYGVNHFITSQTNPIIIWSLRDTQSQDSLWGKWFEINQNATRDWLRATYPFAMELTKGMYPLNLFTRMAYSVATQDYTADINIIPRRKFWSPNKLLSVLSEDETEYLIAEGEAATWPKIEMIRNCTRISRTLDGILDSLNSRSRNTSGSQQAVAGVK